MVETHTGTVEFQVRGMTCAACVGRVERAIAKIPDVLQASVNLATERATVRFDPKSPESTAATIDQIQTSIENSGYAVTRLLPTRPPDALPTDPESISLGRDFWISLLFATPVFLLSMLPMLSSRLMESMMRSMSMPQWNWVLWALASVVQFWPGRRFYRNAYHSIKDLSPDMNVLVVMGTTAAYGVSSLITFFPNWLGRHQQHVYFESSAVVICLVLLGKYLEARSKQSTRESLYGLAKLQPQDAQRVVDQHTQRVAISEISLGDRLAVYEGQAIPLDGVIETGSSFVQEGMVTGEPIPKEKTIGDRVIGGTINGNGQLTIRVTAIGKDTFLSRMMAMVIDAQAHKPPIQTTLDRIIRIFAPSVLLMAIATGLGWWLLSSESAFEKALVHAVAVLVVACPCALGLASPMSMMVGSGRAAELGILFRSHEAIQKLARVDSVVFDKTGTLTLGAPLLKGVWPIATSHPSQSEAEILGLARMAAQSSNHPISIAIREAALEFRPKGFAIESQAVPGKGVRVKLSDRRELALGSYSWMEQQGLTNLESDQLHRELSAQALSVSWLAQGKEILGALGVHDPLKPQSESTIAALSKLGLRTTILSGDQSTAVRTVAQTLHVERWHAEQTPEEKGEKIQLYRDGGETVAFVGDGINDAPALASADVGIAMGNGSQIAISTADVVLASGFVPQVPLAIGLARSVMRNIHQNLFWAFGYNLILLPLAAGWLSPWTNWTFSPMLAALAMGLSSLLVVGNSLRLRYYRGLSH